MQSYAVFFVTSLKIPKYELYLCQLKIVFIIPKCIAFFIQFRNQELSNHEYPKFIFNPVRESHFPDSFKVILIEFGFRSRQDKNLGQKRQEIHGGQITITGIDRFCPKITMLFLLQETDKRLMHVNSYQTHQCFTTVFGTN